MPEENHVRRFIGEGGESPLRGRPTSAVAVREADAHALDRDHLAASEAGHDLGAIVVPGNAIERRD